MQQRWRAGVFVGAALAMVAPPASATPPATTATATTPPAPPATPATPAFEHAVSVNITMVDYIRRIAAPAPPAWALTLAHQLWWAPCIQAMYGLRIAVRPDLNPALRTEGFVNVALAPRLGIWRPSIGFEVGLTTASDVAAAALAPRPVGSTPNAENDEHAYLAFTATPLRFALGILTLSIANVGFGGSFVNLGHTARLQVAFAQLEVRL